MAGAPETGLLVTVLGCRRVKLPRIVPSGTLKRTSRQGRGTVGVLALADRRNGLSREADRPHLSRQRPARASLPENPQVFRL
jgi:hypothetical protein